MFHFLRTRNSQRTVYYALLFIIVAVLAWLALMAPQLVRQFTPSLEPGQVATQDILAPQSITFVSELETERARQQAMEAVSPVYVSVGSTAARQQLERMRAALAFIATVRADSYATTSQKLGDLSALEDVQLGQETSASIISLSEARWQMVAQEALNVLEQVMRSPIRSDAVEDARSRIPSLVSLDLNDNQAAIVTEFTSAFVVPNRLYNETMTQSARQQAAEVVKPVTRSYIAGQTVVSRGKVLTDSDLEALRNMGLAAPKMSWRDPASAWMLTLFLLGFMVLYLCRDPALSQKTRSLAVIAALFASFLLVGRLALPGHTLIPYAYPLAAYSLVVAYLFSTELAIVSSLPLAILVAYGTLNALEMTLFYSLTSLVSILVLGQARRVSSFVWAGASVTISGFLIVAVYRLPQPATDWTAVAGLGGACLINGLATASLTILLQFSLAQFLGTITPMQLWDLARPDHPLLQEILRQAPGTYQHSLQVANLAEQAAENVKADPLLTRIGALYHDAGKAANPSFFIENQIPGLRNPHEDLTPEESARVVIRHVKDGLALASKHHLPRRICDFIAEHHGTTLTRYQYVKAVNLAGGNEAKVAQDKFRYPGPVPQSRETAILMLADGCEARVRAERPSTEEELRAIIKSVIENRVSSGQLDQTDLTLRDLEAIAESFAATLRGLYHPRLVYPKLGDTSPNEATRPLVSTSRKPVEAPVKPPNDPRSSQLSP